MELVISIAKKMKIECCKSKIFLTLVHMDLIYFLVIYDGRNTFYNCNFAQISYLVGLVYHN
jgi:hypothetical protein